MTNQTARANRLQQELTSIKNAQSAERSRKPFAELTDRRQRDILSDINNSFGESGYSVASNAEVPEADVQKCFSFFHMQGLSRHQYREATKLPARKILNLSWFKLSVSFLVSSFYSIEEFGKNLLEKVGGFEMRKMSYIKNGKKFDIEVHIASNIRKVVTCYLQHLYETEWKRIFPSTSIHIVFCADKGLYYKSLTFKTFSF